MKVLVLIPAFNECENLAHLLQEVQEVMPGVAILVVNDGSADDTAAVARKAGALVLDLAFNLGVSGAVQAGYQYACRAGYDCVVRIDGDGQHAPAGIPAVLERLQEGDVDLVVGSRFGVEGGTTSTLPRRIGISLLAACLSRICGTKVTDPTSGFAAVSRRLMHLFATIYPDDYPEPEALAYLSRQGYRFAQVPVAFRERQYGVSSIGRFGAVYFMIKVLLALLVDRARAVDPRLSAENFHPVPEVR